MTLTHLISLVRKLRARLPSRKSCFSIILYSFFMRDGTRRVGYCRVARVITSGSMEISRWKSRPSLIDWELISRWGRARERWFIKNGNIYTLNYPSVPSSWKSRAQAGLFLRKFNFIVSKWLVPAAKGGSSRCISTGLPREIFQDIMTMVFNWMTNNGMIVIYRWVIYRLLHLSSINSKRII